MRGMIKAEEGDDLCSGDWNEQPIVLLLRVTQANGKPLPIGGFKARAMSQMLHEVTGAIPKEVGIMNDHEVGMELDEEMSLMVVSSAIHGLFHWDRQSVMVDILVAKRDLITEIVKNERLVERSRRN